MAQQHKIALVTGGSRGLGKNVALALSKKGIDVILTYRNQKEEADEVAKAVRQNGQQAAVLKLDVGDIPSLNGFIQQLGTSLKEQFGVEKFDFLINNAGISGHYPITETPEALFDNLYNVHLKGVYFLTQKALPLLADGGRIVNISTGLARFAVPGYSAYASMKGAIEVFTRYLAKELGERGITANTIAPGPVETDFNRTSLSNQQTREYLASQAAMKRIGVPDDIGGVVAFLCSPEAGWVTAQRIEISGGIFL